MAAILKLRRGTSASPVLTDGELFLNYTTRTIQFRSGSVTSNLLPLDKSITGDIILNGDITASNILLSGDLSAVDVRLSGNIYLGDEVADNIYVQASLSGSLIPSESAQYDLGSPDKKWDKLYVVSASVDSISLPGSGILSSSNENFTQFSQSVDLRLDNSEWTGSDHKSRIVDLEFTGSNHESRINNLASFTGSYATTGSNTFIGNQTITGSVLISGSTFEVSGLSWPETGSEKHILKTNPYTLNFNGTNRNYSYLGISLEHFEQDPDYFHNSLKIYTYDDHQNPTYGSEFNVGPLRTHMRVIASGSGNLGNISIQDNEYGSTVAIVYADDIQIGWVTGSTIQIGNENTITTIRGGVDVLGNISSSNNITASYFYGDGSNITNIQHGNIDFGGSNIVSGSSQLTNGSGILSSSNENFETFSQSVDLRLDNAEWTGSNQEGRIDIIETTFSSSVDSRLDYLEGNFSSSVDSQLDFIHSYTSSLKQAISVDNQNLIVLGNLTVQGTQTSLNTTQLLVEDILLALASGSTTSAESDGGGIFISGANASMTWNHANQLIEFNTKVSSSVGFKGDGSELINIQHENVDFGGSNILSGSSQVIDLLPSGVVSSSAQISGYNKFLEINGDSVVSSSQQISNYNTFLEINGMGVVSGSSQIDVNDTQNFTTFSQSVDLRLDEIETTFSQSVDSRLDNQELFSSSIDSIIKNKLNVETVISGSSFSSNAQGEITASTNDTTTSFDVGLTTLDSPEFQGLTLTNLSLLGSGYQTALISGSGGVIGARVLGTAAFLNVSASVGDDPNSIPTNQAVSDALIAAGAGDITAINDGTLWSSDYLGLEHTGDGTLNGGYGQVGNVVIAIATGSVRFTEGVVKALPSGLVSGSSQLYSDLDLRYGNELGDGLVSSSAQISSYNTFLEINGMGVVSGSTQITNGSGIISSSAEGSVQGTISLNGSDVNVNGMQTDDSPTFGGLDVNGNLTIEQGSSILLYNTAEDGYAQIVYNETDDKIQLQKGIQPSTDNNWDIGRVGRRVNVIYASTISGSISATNGVVSGSSQIDGTQILNNSITLPDGNDVSLGGTITIQNITNGTGIVSGSSQVFAGSGILSSSTQNFEDFSSSVDLRLDDLESFSSSLDATYEEIASGTHTLVSGSSQLTSSYDSRYVTLEGDQTINGTKTFNDIVVNGTGSFAYITSVTGDAKIIGDNYIILNNDTPTQRYAGIKVFDSGSINTTASLEYDGQNNDWFYQYTDDGGVTDEFGVVLFGPEYSGKGTPTYPTNNTIQKGNGGHHLLDSNITDNGTTITLGSAVDVSGITNFNDTTQSTSKTTGAVIIDGGVGIAKTLNVGEDVVAYASSDRRLKDNILPIENSLQKINQIGGYSFEWNVEKQNIYNGKDYGVIAQEIEQILPELVDTRENGYKAVKYDRLVSLLIEGIKELNKEVSELKEKIKE